MNIEQKNNLTKDFSFAGMTDVIFLLLLFFLIASTFVSSQAIKVDLPSTESRHSVEKMISVSITPDLQIFFEEEAVENFEDLEARFLIEKETLGEFTIKLNADKTTPIENVVRILDIGYKNNIKIFLATAPQQGL